MQGYIFRRFYQAIFTVFGVMLITFLLFRVIAGDVSTAYVNQKLGAEARRAFYEKHKLDRPTLFNYHRRIEIIDNASGPHVSSVQDYNGSQLVKLAGMHLAPWSANEPSGSPKLVSNLFPRLSSSSSLMATLKGDPKAGRKKTADKKTYSANQDTSGSNTAQTSTSATDGPAVLFRLSDGTTLRIDIDGINTVGELLDAINKAPDNRGRLVACLSRWSLKQLFDSQFFWHFYENITFSGKSYATEQSLFEIISERGKFSLALTIPALALEWLISMVIACFVAYYRDSWIDKLGVFLSVLGMCIPYLAYMLIGQAIMFQISPSMASALSHPLSIYVPVGISVVAGVGGMIRFYRTVILDEINRDYVRTAKAKGVSLSSILFIHVLKNCMLPILTNLISTIPFLIMGSLLLERFFGIPGLGDLMLTSITSRDVPIVTGLTFLTSLLYVISLLITDILYAIFDPRIRFQ